MSQQEGQPDFGDAQNGDPFSDEDAVQVDYDLNQLEASTSDDPASQDDAGEPNDAAGPKNHKPGEANKPTQTTVELTQEEFNHLLERIRRLENAVGTQRMDDPWFTEDNEVNIKNRLEGVSQRTDKVPHIEDRVLELQNRTTSTGVFGDGKVDQIAKTIIENYDELSRNGVVTTGGRGRKGLCSLLNDETDLEVSNKNVHDALYKIDTKLGEYRLESSEESGGKVLVRGDD